MKPPRLAVIEDLTYSCHGESAYQGGLAMDLCSRYRNVYIPILSNPSSPSCTASSHA